MNRGIVIIYLILTNTIFSQQINIVRDFGIWGGLTIKREVFKNGEIQLNQQIRYYTNATKFDDYIIDFGGKYKMNKNFKLGANLRYTYDAKRWSEAENNYRYNLDITYKGSITTKLKLYYRLRYQQKFINIFSEFQSTDIHFSGVRNRVKVKYKLNKNNNLYISGELFRLIETYKKAYFNRLRFGLGDEIKTKVGNFNCAFGYEQEINTNYPISFFFLKTVFSFKI